VTSPATHSVDAGRAGDGTRPGAAPGADDSWRVAAAVCVVLVGVAVAASLVNDPAVSELLASAVRAIGLLAACGTVGTLVLAALSAGRPNTSRLPRRAASAWALIWCVSSVASVGLQLSLVRTRPSGLFDSDVAGAFGWSMRGLVATAWAAALVAVLARAARTRRDDRVLLVLALASLLPTALTGHSTHSSAPIVAVLSMVVHVVAVTVWFGGLLALAVHADAQTRLDTVVIRRFSALALVCFVAVAESGVVSALARLPFRELVDAGAYAVLLCLKVALLGVVGVMGLLHRRRTLPRLAAGEPGSFWSLVAGELVVLAAVIGLGVALSTSAPPPAPDAPGGELHAQQAFTTL
jgi:putative copper export protein